MSRQRKAIPADVKAALREVRVALADVYGERLLGVYLYGSYARGDFRPDSDVDLLIALDGEVSPGDEIRCYNEVVSDVCLRHNLLISTYPIPARWLQERRDPLFENVRREAVAV